MPGKVRPFRQFVLKICSRCDLACDHCYVYEYADQSWRGRPKVISDETVTKAAERIAEHARNHALAAVRIILHGGEPLLAGVTRLRHICEILRYQVEQVCELDLRIHTNGVLLSDVYEARTIIEAPAAAILAERRSPEDIATLRRLCAEADAIEGNPMDYLEAHHRFHNAVSDLAGNRTIALLARMIDAIIDAADLQLVKARLADESEIRAGHRAQRTHAKFIDLLESGDAAGAEQLWRKHLSEAGRHVTSAGEAETTLDVMG